MQYEVLSFTYKSLQTGHPSYLRSLLSYTPNRSTHSSSLIILNRPSNSCRLIITNRSFYHILLLPCGTLPSDLRQLSHHFASSQPIWNSPVSALPSSLFQKKAHDSYFSFSICFIDCTIPHFIWTDISGIDLARLLHLTFIS